MHKLGKGLRRRSSKRDSESDATNQLHWSHWWEKHSYRKGAEDRSTFHNKRNDFSIVLLAWLMWTAALWQLMLNCTEIIVTGIFSGHLNLVSLHSQENYTGSIPPDKTFTGNDIIITHIAVVYEAFRLKKKITRSNPHFLGKMSPRVIYKYN